MFCESACCVSCVLWKDLQLYQIIDPKNYRPLYQYVPGILEADDIDILLDNGALRVVPGM